MPDTPPASQASALSSSTRLGYTSPITNTLGAGERVLVVDDEPDITALVAYHLAKAGFRVSTAATGVDALRAVREECPSIIVLDRMLPGMSGDDVLATLRADQALHEIPVLMLTARREEIDRVRGLALGADDYLTKPFSTQELVLRVGAILRRSRVAAVSTDVVTVGPLVIDRAHHRVTIAGRHVELTATEFKLLLTLALRRGRVQSRAQLLEDVWEAAPDVQTRTVDMHVQRLRAKLGTEVEMIETIRGFGYRLRVAGAP
ncbi:MAG TPA: response regulator transcription factor [Gemmatimonadaceae bacterium]